MRLHIKNLHTETTLGVHSWEKEALRPIILNITLEYDASQAAATDNIDDAIDYDTLSQKIATYCKNAKTELIEKLANDLLNLISQDTRVHAAELLLEKPNAIEHAESISIQTHYTNKGS